MRYLSDMDIADMRIDICDEDIDEYETFLKKNKLDRRKGGDRRKAISTFIDPKHDRRVYDRRKK